MATADHQSVELTVTDAFTFGQVLVRPIAGGGFWLSHRDDNEAGLTWDLSRDAHDALEIARIDDAGDYRPLKTVPSLRHGWRLEVASLEDLRRALDLFYPGRLAMLAARDAQRLSSTPLRDTLSRQTGMYRISAKISDKQLDDLVGDFCRSDGGCLRTILWKRDAAGTLPSTNLPPEKYNPNYDQAAGSGAPKEARNSVPLLCQEACNLLVAECRKVVKGER
jgi:sirohydrochlorin cobaltochelatase